MKRKSKIKYHTTKLLILSLLFIIMGITFNCKVDINDISIPLQSKLSGVVSTFAGSGVSGYVDGPVASAQLEDLSGITVDMSGNIYVVTGNRIRKITPAGVVSTFAGSGVEAGYADGPGATAKFSNPHSLAVDRSGNVYVADKNNRIRKITPDMVLLAHWQVQVNMVMQMVQVGATAKFNLPTGITVDTYGNVYVADKNNRIRKITPDGFVSVFAGTGVRGNADGTLTTAEFDYPYSLVIDKIGNLYVTELIFKKDRIRKISLDGIVSVFAGGKK